MFYSKTTGGFYDKNLHTQIPNDAVEITQEKYNELCEGQAFCQSIESDENGHPILVGERKTFNQGQ